MSANNTQAAKLVLDIRAELGEGPIWDARTNALLWVDIEGRRVCRFDPAANGGRGENREWPVGSMPGTVAPTERGDLLVALNEGVARFDMADGRVEMLCAPDGFDPSVTRFNDGKCDPRGRFVAGTTSLQGKRGASALYVVEATGANGSAPVMRQILGGVSISNGLAWSADGRSFYYIDTPTREVAVFDYDLDRGELGARRVAFRVPDALGYPDGMTIDAEGMLWVCLWGGAAVTRWNPANGELLAKHEVPALHVTSCAFGGPDLATLYITTARVDTAADVLAKYPQRGGIFSLQPGVRGGRAFEFSG
ncbi:SMP-30/gluconolactonase/LRE family protein [Ereboglobus luteus]|uniref:SMP-30/Gluconolactonase/LRE-like region domain-containing protein n=1 Tax=Ereboglobus luteus TaxID=1796921 RepID=A0A2U8E4A1_9BACT|nr:SMP-30/gluconolactonase/LRE family protein [Ereboglobus luteus]AWI09739.1 hypothetical protein CKA38_11180 [Ereboglobus luteus]